MLAQLSYNGKYNIPKAELCVKLSNRDETFNGAFFSKLYSAKVIDNYTYQVCDMNTNKKNSTRIGKEKFGQI